jgi:hypothetical protein
MAQVIVINGTWPHGGYVAYAHLDEKGAGGYETVKTPNMRCVMFKDMTAAQHYFLQESVPIQPKAPEWLQNLYNKGLVKLEKADI